MSEKRLGARSDFDEWASAVVTSVKKHRRRHGASPSEESGRDVFGLRRWASRMRAKIAG